MRKNLIKSLIISCFMLLICFGLTACKEENTKYTLNIYVDNEIYQTVELEKSEIDTYTLPTLDLQKDNLYYFSGWTGDVYDNKLMTYPHSTVIEVHGEYKPIFSVTENGELTIYENDITKSFESLIIPSAINGINVTSLGSYKFSGLNKLKTISLPSTFQTISYDAFADCESLQKIYIPDNVTKIEGGVLKIVLI